MRHLVFLSFLLGLAWVGACAGRNSTLTDASADLSEAPSATPAKPTAEGEPTRQEAGDERPEPTAEFYSPANPRPTAKPAPAPAATSSARPSSGGSSQDDPKISRSAGQAGGVMVLWPRVIPTDITDMNRRLVQEVQTHVRVLVQRTAPGKALDVRPEPERVCRRSGCEATSVNVLFTRHGDGCAVVALITPPGPVETTLVPWAGGVEISRTQIPFRDAPESYIKVKDLARCSELTQVMRQNDAAVEAAVRAAIP